MYGSELISYKSCWSSCELATMNPTKIVPVINPHVIIRAIRPPTRRDVGTDTQHKKTSHEYMNRYVSYHTGVDTCRFGTVPNKYTRWTPVQYSWPAHSTDIIACGITSTSAINVKCAARTRLAILWSRT